MKRVDIRKRVISGVICKYCGSAFELRFDETHDEYICSGCCQEEQDKIAIDDEPDEDALNEQARLRNL